MYIRFGEIPEGERSGVYHAGELVRKEDGVSVYDAKIDDRGNVSVCLPLPINANTLGTFRNLVEYENRNCYLVNGEYIGKGSDNEPLIRNVNIIKKIEYRTIMKQRIIFEGELSDPELDKVLPDVIAKAKKVKDDVFVYWNGITLRVRATDNVDDLMCEYRKGLYSKDILQKACEEVRDGRDKHLYIANNKIDNFYVVAHSFDEAVKEVEERLNQSNYGFSIDRKVTKIEELAAQRFDVNIYNQSFSDTRHSLIIVGDL